MSSFGGGSPGMSAADVAFTMLAIASDPEQHKVRLGELRDQQKKTEDAHAALLEEHDKLDERHKALNEMMKHVADERASIDQTSATFAEREHRVTDAQIELAKKVVDLNARESVTAAQEAAAKTRHEDLDLRETGISTREIELGKLEKQARDLITEYEGKVNALAALVGINKPQPPL